MIRESIKQAMKFRNWSAVQLSDHTGIRHPTLTEFLSGKKGISFEYVEMIFETLNLSVKEGGKNKNEPDVDQTAKGADQEARTRLLGVCGRHLWLDPDDLEFAKALQEENRLEALRWLCEKARLHSLTPLKDAKDILDAYR